MTNFAKSTKTQIHFDDSEIVFSVNSRVYSHEVILKACYNLIDKIYIFLDSPRRGETAIYLKAKTKLTAKQLENLRDEFLNDLVNSAIRKTISRQNQKIVELVVGGAINAALTKPPVRSANVEKDEDEDIQAIEKEIAALKKELEKECDDCSVGDPRRIQKPV